MKYSLDSRRKIIMRFCLGLEDGSPNNAAVEALRRNGFEQYDNVYGARILK